MKKSKHSALFQYIQRQHGEQSWGKLLDAGTGVNSLSWVTELATESWTAVTGSEAEAQRVREAVAPNIRLQDNIVVGNWAGDTLLKGEVFDTVIADYLLGAIEGYAPFFQPYLFERLRPLVGKTLYVSGLEPYVPIVRPDDPSGQILWEIGRFRDACVLLKGGLPYREYPAQWVADRLLRASFKVKEVKHFKIGYKASFVNAQINIALSALETTVEPALAQSLISQGEHLREKALSLLEKEGALRFCRNYVITAEPK